MYIVECISYLHLQVSVDVNALVTPLFEGNVNDMENMIDNFVARRFPGCLCITFQAIKEKICFNFDVQYVSGMMSTFTSGEL